MERMLLLKVVIAYCLENAVPPAWLQHAYLTSGSQLHRVEDVNVNSRVCGLKVLRPYYGTKSTGTRVR